MAKDSNSPTSNVIDFSIGLVFRKHRYLVKIIALRPRMLGKRPGLYGIGTNNSRFIISLMLCTMRAPKKIGMKITRSLMEVKKEVLEGIQ